jgi:hypothetical protein
MPLRMAICWTAPGVRPDAFAAAMTDPYLARRFSSRGSTVVHERRELGRGVTVAKTYNLHYVLVRVTMSSATRIVDRPLGESNGHREPARLTAYIN